MPAPLTLLAALQAEPGTFDFFAALRALECACPDQPRLGRSQRVQDDPVRFGQTPGLTFSPGMIDAFMPATDARPARLQLNFFGLTGPNGPLPLHLTEYIRERMRNTGDPTLARFLDVFHHRLIMLFYRAWASAQPAVSLDRPADDRFADYVASLPGLGMASLRDRDTVPHLAKLHYAGRLADQRRNAEGLGAILADFFQVPVRIVQFVGHWMRLAPGERTRLRGGVQGARLGVTTIVGEAVWNRQHKFRVECGPLTYAMYCAMLPGGASLHRLVDWVRLYAGAALAWDLRLVLKKEEIPPLRLGGGGGAGRLGYTTWLASAPARRDADQLCFTPVPLDC